MKRVACSRSIVVLRLPPTRQGHAAPNVSLLTARIRASAAHMNDLIEGLLELARVSHSTLAHEPVDLSHIALNALAALKERDPWRSVEVACPSGIMAIGDQRMLSIVLHNLLDLDVRPHSWSLQQEQPIIRELMGKLLRHKSTVLKTLQTGRLRKVMKFGRSFR